MSLFFPGHSSSKILPCSLRFERGFTLAEILVAAVIGAIVMMALSSTMLQYFAQSERLKLSQYFKEEASRFNYLLQIEAGESSVIVASPTESLPSSCAASGSKSPTAMYLRMDIPRPFGAYADAANVSSIYYYLQDGNINRCGPPFEQNGTIDHGSFGSPSSPVSGVVVRDASMNIFSGAATCNSQATGGRQVVYSLVFSDNKINYQAPCAVARAKTFLVRDATL